MSFLQKNLKYILILAQCFGILPVYGIYSDNPKSLRFAWFSCKVSYTIFLTICTLFPLGMGCYNFLTNDFELSNLSKYNN